MFTSADETGLSRRFQLAQAERLNLPERIAVLTIVAGMATVDIIGFFAAPDAVPARTAVSIALTLSFTLFIWSPIVAASALGVLVALSFFVDTAITGLVAGAIGAGFILRLATTPLILSYVGGLLLSVALYAAYFDSGESAPVVVALVLIVAIVVGGVGLALRMSYSRGHRLERELEAQAEREREAVLAERRWIAGELHDSIAHHLTVIAMHVQLIDDDDIRPTSQVAIQGAARKALSDLRFVIEMAEEAPRGTGVPSGDLVAAIDEAREEFEATGHTVATVGDPGDESIPRGAEIILARIVRESATNILKYAGPGEIRFVLDLQPEFITLTIRSPLPDTPRRDLPSTGTGLNRMAERVLGVSGEFDAGPEDGAWVVSVRLPVA